MKKQYTTGPWAVDSSGKIVSEEHVICNLEDQIYPVQQPDELLANARLIAAAPELLEALERMLTAHDADVEMGSVIAACNGAAADSARAALAKVRGK